jgi:GTP cyclohydrolase II
LGERNLTEHELRHADGDFRVVVLGEVSEMHGNQPCAAVFGEPTDGCLVRIHSRCVYGEIFESVDCDCRDQLRQSMAMMRKAGAGVLIYLDQEGRGAGLLAKALGYQLTQRQGLDTFSSYRKLGLLEDVRTYEDAVAILRSLNLKRVRLLTNNPAKVAALSTADFQVEQQPFLVRGQSPEARRYLAAKARYGHTIPLAKLDTFPERVRRWARKLVASRKPAPVVEFPVTTLDNTATSAAAATEMASTDLARTDLVS